MKKILVVFFCMLMLVGCQKTDYTQFYEDTYALLEKQGITMGLGTSTGKIVIYGDNENPSSQYMCMLDNDLDTVSIINYIIGNCVYGADAGEDEVYKAFLEKTTLTQKELNQFSKLFYEKNIDKAKAGAPK